MVLAIWKPLEGDESWEFFFSFFIISIAVYTIFQFFYCIHNIDDFRNVYMCSILLRVNLFPVVAFLRNVLCFVAKMIALALVAGITKSKPSKNYFYPTFWLLEIAGRILWNRGCASFCPSVFLCDHLSVSSSVCLNIFSEMDYFFLNFGVVLETYMKLCVPELGRFFEKILSQKLGKSAKTGPKIGFSGFIENICD